MIFFLALILAVITGFLLNQSWEGLKRFELKGAELFIAGFFLQAVLQHAGAIDLSPPEILSAGLHVVSYLLLLAALVLNLDLRGIGVIILGVGLNLLVVLANGGRMPVALDRYGIDPARTAIGTDPLHVPLDASTRLSLLSDLWLVPLPFGQSSLISLGDLFMAAGLFVLFIHVFQQKNGSSPLP